MKRSRALFAVLLFALGAGSTAVPPSARAQEHDINEMIANAKSPADHEAIATYYDKAAAEAEAQAQQHKKMADTYSKYRPDYKPLPSHCRAEAKHYEGIATENRALATAHRKMAQEKAK